MAFATEFRGIPAALAQEDALRILMVDLISNRPILGKSVEGVGRAEKLRQILIGVATARIPLETAAAEVRNQLPRTASPHSTDNRVFPTNWAERLVTVQFSRFYSQAVLTHLVGSSVETCLIPHAEEENPAGRCAMFYAGKPHHTVDLLKSLVDAYEKGLWSEEVRVPAHPDCHHVAAPFHSIS